MSIEIKTTRRDGIEDLKILLYGPSGAGKTSSIKTLPCKDEEVLVISTERGNEVLRNRDYALYDDCAEDPQKLGELFIELKKGHNYKWIIWDSLSDWSDKMLQKIEHEMTDKEKSNVFALWGKLKKKVMDANKVFLSLPNCNKISICGAAENPDTGKMQFLMNGSAKDSLAFYYDELYAIKVVKEEDKMNRYFITNSDNTYVCKSRMSGGGEVQLELYEPADFGKLINKCYGGK